MDFCVFSTLTVFKKCLRQLQFSDEEVDSIFCVASGLLHLGNVQFAGEEKVPHKLRRTHLTTFQVQIDNPETLEAVCLVWGLTDPDTLASALTTRYSPTTYIS